MCALVIMGTKKRRFRYGQIQLHRNAGERGNRNIKMIPNVYSSLLQMTKADEFNAVSPLGWCCAIVDDDLWIFIIVIYDLVTLG